VRERYRFNLNLRSVIRSRAEKTILFFSFVCSKKAKTEIRWTIEISEFYSVVVCRKKERREIKRTKTIDQKMVKLTMIARVIDGLPLAEGLEYDQSIDLEFYKQQAKQVFKRLSMMSTEQTCSRMSYESGDYLMHYVIDQGVCYLTLCERAYPKKLAYAYLEELQREFQEKHGSKVLECARPYAFIKFDSFIQKTRKVYGDQRAQRNLEKLNEDLNDIQNVMTRNINDILEQGERLDRVTDMSGNLAQESKKYAKRAKDLSRQALIQKYMPVIVLFGLFAIVYGFRRFFS
jgi:vesicle transport protein SEC22